MKKEIQFIFDEGEDKRNEDDDSLKILLEIVVFFYSFIISLGPRLLYLLLDGLRSNGRLNNFINTPIKKRQRKKLVFFVGSRDDDDDEDKKMGEIGLEISGD